MSQQELLKRVVEVLDSAGVQYMAVGSIVSSLHGEPRSTHDIDLVVAITREAAAQIVAAFPPPLFYVDMTSAQDAIATHGMFNLLDVTGGDKVDFWVLADTPYDRESFTRRYVEDVLGVKLCVQRPEDTILSKLRWAEMAGGSEKQYTDALRVYEVQFGNLDLSYLERWSGQLGLRELWSRLKVDAQPIE